MNHGFQTLVEHFQTHGWRFQTDEERRLVDASFGGKNGNFRCFAVVDESDDLLQFFTLLPVVVPPHKRQAVAELCIRASYVLKLGDFELDFSDGEVRFHTAAPYPEGQLADDVIRRTVMVNLVMADIHLPAFMSAIYADVPPADALRQVRIAVAQPEVQAQPFEPGMASRIRFN